MNLMRQIIMRARKQLNLSLKEAQKDKRFKYILFNIHSGTGGYYLSPEIGAYNNCNIKRNDVIDCFKSFGIYDILNSFI